MIKLDIQLFGGEQITNQWIMGVSGYKWEGPDEPDYSIHPLAAYRIHGAAADDLPASARNKLNNEGLKKDREAGVIRSGGGVVRDGRDAPFTDEPVPKSTVVKDEEDYEEDYVEPIRESEYPRWQDFIGTGGGDGLKHNNWGGVSKGTDVDLQIAFELYIQNGGVPPTYSQFIAAGGQESNSAWKNISYDLETIVGPAWEQERRLQTDVSKELPEGIQAATGDGLSERERMYNQYYKDLYSLEDGTLGKNILTNNESLYKKEAENATMLANTSVQAQAMQQAQNVKAVTDSLRAERMSQLRGGMSEAQLADRELQMLMSGTEQFNNQGMMASQEAMAGKLAATTAKETAFNDYIAQATALGQNAAANYASEAGDVYALTAKYMQEAAASGRPLTWDEAFTKASGTGGTT